LEQRGRSVSFDSQISVVEFHKSAMEWYDDEQESTETDEKITGCFLNNIFRSTSQHSANLFLLEHEIQSGKYILLKLNVCINDFSSFIRSIFYTYI